MHCVFVRKIITLESGNNTTTQSVLVRLSNVSQISYVAVEGGHVYRVSYTDGGVVSTVDLDADLYVCSIGKELF